jgi:hypothetical protein
MDVTQPAALIFVVLPELLLSAPENVLCLPTPRMLRLALADRQFPETRHKKCAVSMKMNVG